ncbi:MAG: ABC transporter substrate-binding protein [Erythrobacter sp.]
MTASFPIRLGRNLRAAFGLVLGVALAASLLAGCAPADGGGAATAPDHPRPAILAPTFVSLNPCLDAILVEVALRDQVLALSHYSRDPEGSSIDLNLARSLPYTGGTAEEVIALAPDIVLASTFMAPATKAALERSGLRVETFGSAATVEESMAQVKRIAALAERPLAARGLTLSVILQRAPAFDEPVSAMLWQPGQIVPGEATLIAEHMRWAGFSSHSAARGLGQADHVSLEAVLADPPDLLLIAGDAAGQRHPMLDTLTGTRVESFDPSLLYCGGPTIVRARDRLKRIRESMEKPAQ